MTSFRSEPLPAELAGALASAGTRLGRLGRRVEFFQTIGSTNDAASSRAASGDYDGSVFIADAQTSGRGRRGRTWFSPPGTGLYVSTILTPGRSRDAERATLLTTLAAGVALVEGIRDVTGLPAVLKWPNDLYVGKRKLAGILAEGAGSAVVLGYGINISGASYPPELADRVTSLESELGRGVDRFRVLAETLCALSRRYDDLLEGRFDAILDAWRTLAPAAEGTRVSWAASDGTRSGITAGIDDHGALLVRTANGIERIVAGAINWNL